MTISRDKQFIDELHYSFPRDETGVCSTEHKDCALCSGLHPSPVFPRPSRMTMFLKANNPTNVFRANLKTWGWMRDFTFTRKAYK